MGKGGEGRAYNGANPISSAGCAYDDNGNLTHDGTNAYGWDRSNRLLAMGGASFFALYSALNLRPKLFHPFWHRG